MNNYDTHVNAYPDAEAFLISLQDGRGRFFRIRLNKEVWINLIDKHRSGEDLDV
jgi:hypothetical protein